MSAQPRDNAVYDGYLRISAQVLGGLLRELNAKTRELKATQDLLTNPHLKPAQKIVSYNALGVTGAAPGRPATERAAEYTETTRGLIAYRSGMSTGQVGPHIQAAADAGLIRKQTYRTFDEDANGRSIPRQHARLAPPDGQGWVETWANPRQIQAIEPPKRFVYDQNRKAEERARVKAILAECPNCHSPNVELRCKNCGVITHVDEIAAVVPLAAPRATTENVQNAESASWTEDAAEDAEGLAPRATTENVQNADSAFWTQENPPNVQNAENRLLRYDSYHNAESAFWTDTRGGGVDVAWGEEEPPTPVSPLDAAVAVIAPAVIGYPDHIRMLARRVDGDAKYTTIASPLTEALVHDHLVGRRSLGAGLCQPAAFQAGARFARAIAFDSDADLLPLTRGAARLARAGLRPLLVRNPSKAASGHLWLFFDAAIDANAALAAVRTIAPDLAEVKEMFPNPEVSNGHRIRLPGGYYLPVGAPRVAVDVAVGDESGRPVWVSGVTQEGLAVIGAALSRAAILMHTFVPPARRMKLMHAADAPPVTRRQQVTVSGDGRAFFDRFNAQNPIESMVTVNRKGKFCAPWRHEEVASVHVYPDGGWYDFGADKRHGKDAFDLWCALNGYWDAAANKPDRKAAYRALNPLPQRERATEQRGDATATEAQHAMPGAPSVSEENDPFAGIWDGGEE